MKLALFASWLLYITDITSQRLSSFSNFEVNISVVPWSNFLVFQDILCALNFSFYLQVVISGCKIWRRYLLFTWKDTSCSFICSFIFVIFTSHVEIVSLIGSFSSNHFDEIERVLSFKKIEQTDLVKQECITFYWIDYQIRLSNLVKFIKLFRATLV